jgi:NADPH:quinone reductase
MRAIVCKDWGKVEDLSLEDVTPPTAKPGEVLIDVKAAAVNFADSIMVAGRYQTKPDLPFTPGLEASGVIAACGDGVTEFRPGDRVMAMLAHGGYAEQATASTGDVFVIPNELDFNDAATFPVSYISSDVAIRWQGRLAAGETMLVLGAAGGVGLTAVEIGKAMGARVIAAASSAEKLAIAREHGADETINYTEDSLKDQVMALTDNRGVDVCFDPVGGDLFDSALSSLAWGGRLLVVGFVGGIPQIPANRLLVKNRSALGCSLRHYRWNEPDKLRQSVAALFEWYKAGKLSPLVTHTYALEDTVEAIGLLTSRRAFGKIIVNP